jgi:hypothetical protein
MLSIKTHPVVVVDVWAYVKAQESGLVGVEVAFVEVEELRWSR